MGQLIPDALSPHTVALHATGVQVADFGLLLRGPSGCGKSRLACDLLFHAREAGRFAALVGDDSITLTRNGDALWMTGHSTITGQMEVRGLGILDVQSVQTARLTHVIELSGTQERLPERSNKTHEVLFGVSLPHFNVSSGAVTATALLGLLFETVTFAINR